MIGRASARELASSRRSPLSTRPGEKRDHALGAPALRGAPLRFPLGFPQDLPVVPRGIGDGGGGSIHLSSRCRVRWPQELSHADHVRHRPAARWSRLERLRHLEASSRWCPQHGKPPRAEDSSRTSVSTVRASGARFGLPFRDADGSPRSMAVSGTVTAAFRCRHVVVPSGASRGMRSGCNRPGSSSQTTAR